MVDTMVNGQDLQQQISAILMDVPLDSTTMRERVEALRKLHSLDASGKLTEICDEEQNLIKKLWLLSCLIALEGDSRAAEQFKQIAEGGNPHLVVEVNTAQLMIDAYWAAYPEEQPHDKEEKFLDSIRGQTEPTIAIAQRLWDIAHHSLSADNAKRAKQEFARLRIANHSGRFYHGYMAKGVELSA